MLDASIQERLKPSLRRKRRYYLPFLLAATTIPLLIAGYYFYTRAEVIDDHQLGKLAVLAAESLQESPAGIWVMMEQYIGKTQENFTSEDSLRAAKYLMRRIDVGNTKKEKNLPFRLDL